MRGITKFLLGSGISGVLLCLAMPPADFGFLGWVCLVPVMLAVRETRFIFGFLAGLIMCLVAAWLANAGFPRMIQHPGESSYWTFSGFLVLGVVTGLGLAVFANFKELRSRHCVLIACWAVLFECASLIALPVHLALSQHKSFLSLVAASFGGVWLVSGILWFVNAWIVASFTSGSNHGKKYAALTAIIALAQIPPFVVAKSFTVAAVQTKATDSGTLVQLHYRAGKLADLVILPELAGVEIAEKGKTDFLRRISQEGKPFVTSFRDDAEPFPHNAAALFWRGNESERYFKRKPFAGEKADHQAGTRPVSVLWEQGVMGLNICFDSCYPAVMRETALLPGVNVIALPTLDPDTPRGFAQAIHAAFTPFRCAELGVPIIRSDTTGYSQVFTPFGVSPTLDLEPDSIKLGKIDLDPINTIYKRFGDWVLWVCVAGAFSPLFEKLRSNRPAANQV